jgi:sugar phosphate permease
MLPSERGAAQGLTHAGARLGGAATSVAVVALIAAFGWRAPFVVFAGVGVAWAALWFWFYRDSPAEHPMVNAAERELIAGALGRGGEARQAPPWRALLARPQLWILSAMYVCYAFDMGVFLTWFPKYLNDARGFSLAQMGLYASLPLAAGVIGDIAGGWISDRLVDRLGLTLARRLVAVAGYGLSAVAIPLACCAHDPMASVAFFCLAVFGLELTVGVSWAVTLDVGGAFAGSVSAVMNTFGNLGGAFASALTGYLVTAYGWHAPFLVLAAIAGLGGVLFLWLDAARPLAPSGAAAAASAPAPTAFETPASAGEAS